MLPVSVSKRYAEVRRWFRPPRGTPMEGASALRCGATQRRPLRPPQQIKRGGGMGSCPPLPKVVKWRSPMFFLKGRTGLWSTVLLALSCDSNSIYSWIESRISSRRHFWPHGAPLLWFLYESSLYEHFLWFCPNKLGIIRGGGSLRFPPLFDAYFTLILALIFLVLSPPILYSVSFSWNKLSEKKDLLSPGMALSKDWPSHPWIGV